MSRYLIRYNIEAVNDLMVSFEWGVVVWGSRRAQKWFTDLENFIEQRLSSMPASCPVAPESEELGTEIRQLIYRRYRVLFSISDDLVRILHVRGPYRNLSESE